VKVSLTLLGIGLALKPMKVVHPGGAEKLGYEAPTSNAEFPGAATVKRRCVGAIEASSWGGMLAAARDVGDWRETNRCGKKRTRGVICAPTVAQLTG